MTSRTSFRVALAVAAIGGMIVPAFLLGPFARAQETKARAVSALDSLPADTTLLVRLRSFSEVEKKFKASPIYALRDHPDLKKFVDDVQKKLVEGLADTRDKLGFEPTELFTLIEGEVVFAVGGLDKIAGAIGAELTGGGGNVKPGDLPIILIADAGASAPKLRERLGKLFEVAQKNGAKKESEDFRGGKITTLTQSQKEKGEKDGLEKLYFGDLGSTVLLSVSRPYLEQTMANLTSPAMDSLTKTADFAATQKELRGDSDLLFFINVKPISTTLRKTLQANPIASMIWGLVEGKILGKSMRNAGISITFRENDLRQVAFVNNGGASDGIMGALKGPAMPARPSSVIPEEADEFTSISLNIPALYALIKDVAATAMSMTQGMMGGPGGQMPDPEQQIEAMFQVKPKQVIDALGSAFHWYKKGAQKQDNNPLGNLTLALELKDEMPLKDLLGKLAQMTGLQVQKYLDRDFYPLKAMAGDADGPALAIADKLLVVGTKGDSVKEVIRRSGKGGKTVGDTPNFQSLSSVLPAQLTILGYQSAKSFRDKMRLVKDALSQADTEIQIPDLSALADVVQGSIGYGLWKDQGFYYEEITPLKKPGQGTKAAPAGEKKAQGGGE